jgi:hypothetical protein
MIFNSFSLIVSPVVSANRRHKPYYTRNFKGVAMAGKIEEMNGWVREGDGPWKPAPDRRVYVVDSGVWPMQGIAPGGSVTIDLHIFAFFMSASGRRNYSRDMAIRDLWNAGKSEGEIRLALKTTYTSLKAATVVRSVLRRLRNANLIKRRVHQG